jgi:alpha-L-fucosidase
MTLNENWGYHVGDHNWKNARAVIRMLTETASNAGNLLLNIGPKADGTIPQPSVDILREAGDWLRRNPGWLADSGRSPFTWNNWGRITVNGSRIYLHIFNSPGTQLRVADIGNRVLRVTYLDGGAPVSFKQTHDLVILSDLPWPLKDPIGTTLVIEVDGTPTTTRTQTSFWIPE